MRDRDRQTDRQREMYVYTNMITCARFSLKQMNTEQRDEIGVAIESWF